MHTVWPASAYIGGLLIKNNNASPSMLLQASRLCLKKNSCLTVESVYIARSVMDARVANE